MKYRRLTTEELKELEEDFKHFLIANSVYKEEWEEINKKDKDKANLLVDLFSDIVLEKTLKKIKFLEHIAATTLKVFHCKENEIDLIAISSNDAKLDMRKYEMINFMHDMEIFKTSKTYTKSREEEVFDLLNKGCSIIDEKRYKKIELAYLYSTKSIKN